MTPPAAGEAQVVRRRLAAGVLQRRFRTSWALAAGRPGCWSREQREAVRGLVGSVVPTVPRSFPSCATAAWTALAVVACASAAPSAVSVGDEASRGKDRSRAGRSTASRLAERLALVDRARRVLDQVRQRGAEVVELVGEVGVAELARGDRGVGDRGRAGDDDAHRDLRRSGSPARRTGRTSR